MIISTYGQNKSTTRDKKQKIKVRKVITQKQILGANEAIEKESRYVSN